MEIGLVAGHCDAAPGAAANGLVEHSYCDDLATRVTLKLLALHPWCAIYTPVWLYDIPPVQSLNQRIAAFNDCGVAVAVELHLNASRLRYPNYKLLLHCGVSQAGRELAQSIGHELDRCCPWHPSKEPTKIRADEGFSKHKRLAFLHGTTMPAVIVEPAFITHRPSARAIQSESHRDDLAQAIAAGIVSYLEDHPPRPNINRLNVDSSPGAS